jgi:hypothetical protein
MYFAATSLPLGGFAQHVSPKRNQIRQSEVVMHTLFIMREMAWNAALEVNMSRSAPH